ncbi:MAG: hypothetical protein HY721_30540, partial [Planctomycetes bacterium]|nr:hypothetical protein [Planctomycetota bacterium]
SRRLLATTQSRALPERLADRLIPLAKLPPDFRFLANTVPAREQADRLLERARGAGAALAVELEEILKHRRFPRAAEGAPGPGKPVASRRAR